MAEAPILSNPPDWNAFTLDLFCPRCDYNVRMLTGSRCPECGLDLDWPRIVAAAEQRVDNPLFEYRWRDRPVRSFVYTLRMCLRPWRLWKWLSIADAPRPTGLTVFALLMCLFYIAMALSANAVGLATLLMAHGRSAGSIILHSLHNMVPDIGRESLLELFVHFLIAALLWLFLQLFQQTISKHRIRKLQLSRLVVFAFVSLLTVKLLNVISIVYLYSYTPASWFPVRSAYVLVDSMALGMCFISLGFGLNCYLQIPRGWGIAICLMVLTFLTCLTFVVVVSIAAGSWANPVALAFERAWPGLAYSLWLLLGL